MIAPERSDLYAIHQHHAELCAYQMSPGKQPEQIFRAGIG
jgi:hypothetical protein